MQQTVVRPYAPSIGLSFENVFLSVAHTCGMMSAEAHVALNVSCSPEVLGRIDRSPRSHYTLRRTFSYQPQQLIPNSLLGIGDEDSVNVAHTTSGFYFRMRDDTPDYEQAGTAGQCVETEYIIFSTCTHICLYLLFLLWSIQANARIVCGFNPCTGIRDQQGHSGPLFKICSLFADLGTSCTTLFISHCGTTRGLSLLQLCRSTFCVMHHAYSVRRYSECTVSCVP